MNKLRREYKQQYDDFQDDFDEDGNIKNVSDIESNSKNNTNNIEQNISTTNLIENNSFYKKSFLFFSRKDLIFNRILIYITLVKVYIPMPDILLMLMSFYLSKNEPTYLLLPFQYKVFFLLSGIFKLFSLISYIPSYFIFEKVKKENNIEHTFCSELYDNIYPFSNYYTLFVLIAYFNLLWDIFLLVCMKCHGSEYCSSIILTHSISEIEHSVELRRILEVHIFYSGMISNFVHIVATPIVIYFWNKHKKSMLKILCCGR
jgi:hypothetical protein